MSGVSFVVQMRALFGTAVQVGYLQAGGSEGRTEGGVAKGLKVL